MGFLNRVINDARPRPHSLRGAPGSDLSAIDRSANLHVEDSDQGAPEIKASEPVSDFNQYNSVDRVSPVDIDSSVCASDFRDHPDDFEYPDKERISSRNKIPDEKTETPVSIIADPGLTELSVDTENISGPSQVTGEGRTEHRNDTLELQSRQNQSPGIGADVDTPNAQRSGVHDGAVEEVLRAETASFEDESRSVSRDEKLFVPEPSRHSVLDFPVQEGDGDKTDHQSLRNDPQQSSAALSAENTSQRYEHTRPSKSDMRVEGDPVGSQGAGRQQAIAPAEPRVRIGQIDIVVQAPPARTKPAVVNSYSDLASRRYLRRL